MTIRRLPSIWLVALGLWAGALRTEAQENYEGDLPQQDGFEMGSPEELVPSTIEPGLSSRAVPILPDNRPAPAKESAFYRVSNLSDIAKVRPAEARSPLDPADYRSVVVNVPPIGLRPMIYRPGVIEVYPFFGLAQSFDSNVNLTPTNQIADFYLTPRAGAEVQLGTPDSAYNEYYDTILALNVKYEAWADLYYENPNLSAFNQSLEVSGRIGRSAAIWRPYFMYTNVTGSNLLMADLVNRTERIRVMPSVLGEYQFTTHWGMNQTFGYQAFDHPNPTYINTQMGQTRQEVTYLVLNNMKASLWGQYRYTEPDRGFSGSEMFVGVGLMGKPDPRVYTEIRIGWDIMDMEGTVKDRNNMSGLRFNGYTTFDWGPRFRLTVLYDRDYVFNEVQENDNYVSTLLQAKGEFFLGGNWYITPYLGVSFQEFETSHQLLMQYRPELEVSYALPSDSRPNESRFYAKVAYMKSEALTGDSEPIENIRFSLGMNWQF